MNLTQAEAIASLYAELVKAVDLTKIDPPSRSVFHKTKFTLDQVSSTRFEDGQIVIEWSAYAGCGDYDTDTTYHSLEQFFEY